MKADTSNYNANIAKARKQLQGFKEDNLTMGGIMKQTTGSIVAAAAQYASFAAVLGTVASGFAEAVSRGTEMSREMEGVKMAFDRINQPGLLDNLREATHNTVNDLELMKQAVKFDNFNLSIEQMGTFLAFAQQQAKDTGQDVNYLVDSIVTGLGRKSLPILDNLGLSAEEIRDRMKETGDMTKAVAQIIQERMEAAGGYVETASDRAAQAQVRLDNAMTDLGRTMDSLTGEGASLWTELKIGAIDLANTAIKPLIQLFNTLAGYIRGTSVEDIVTKGMTDVTDTVDDNGRLIRKNAINKIPEIKITGNAPQKTPRFGGGGSKRLQKTPEQIAREQYDKMMLKSQALANDTSLKPMDLGEPSDAFKAYTSSLADGADQALSPLQKLNAELEEMKANLEMAPDSQAYQQGLSLIAEKQKEIDQFTGANIVKQGKETEKSWKSAASAASSFGSALSGIDDPAAKIAGTIAQAVANIALAFSSADMKDGETGNVWYWIAATAAGVATMISTISTIRSATGYAQGGMIKGNSYSGDNIMANGGTIGLNAGEVVLTKAMQGNLASQLADQNRGLQIVGVVKGESLVLVSGAYRSRTGHATKGERLGI
jgi:hypothetical protein